MNEWVVSERSMTIRTTKRFVAWIANSWALRHICLFSIFPCQWPPLECGFLLLLACLPWSEEDKEKVIWRTDLNFIGVGWGTKGAICVGWWGDSRAKGRWAYRKRASGRQVEGLEPTLSETGCGTGSFRGFPMRSSEPQDSTVNLQGFSKQWGCLCQGEKIKTARGTCSSIIYLTCWGSE